MFRDVQQVPLQIVVVHRLRPDRCGTSVAGRRARTQQGCVKKGGQRQTRHGNDPRRSGMIYFQHTPHIDERWGAHRARERGSSSSSSSSKMMISMKKKERKKKRSQTNQQEMVKMWQQMSKLRLKSFSLLRFSENRLCACVLEVCVLCYGCSVVGWGKMVPICPGVLCPIPNVKLGEQGRRGSRPPPLSSRSNQQEQTTETDRGRDTHTAPGLQS